MMPYARHSGQLISLQSTSATRWVKLVLFFEFLAFKFCIFLNIYMHAYFVCFMHILYFEFPFVWTVSATPTVSDWKLQVALPLGGQNLMGMWHTQVFW